MVIDPSNLDRRARNRLINGLVLPRPIAWVSTIGGDGTRNLAPFSFFGAFSFDPPTVGIGPGARKGVHKDTLSNVRATGEFVVNLVDRSLAEIVNACSGEWGPEVDEWEVAGVEGLPSETVAPFRVARAPAALECRVRQILELGEPDRPSNNLVVGWVTRIHVRDDAMDDLIPDPVALDLVGRLGGDQWCTTRDQFTLPRPFSNDPDEVARSLMRSQEPAATHVAPPEDAERGVLDPARQGAER
jgi:flavin reductase (DIM6/NTAB) family NADH-FMN oxidoreductase RutF